MFRASYFAYIFLAPLIAEFARRYPGITFDFDLTPRVLFPDRTLPAINDAVSA